MTVSRRDSFCSQATQKTAFSKSGIQGIPNAHLVTCHTTSSGSNFEAATFSKGKVMAIIQSSGLGRPQLSAVARKQYRAL